jgi:AraC-like DNA-binding protein
MKKSAGFEGELVIEIPQTAIRQCELLPLIGSLFITRMGFYPKAMNHYFKRPAGTSQVILLYCTDGKGWVQLQKSNVKVSAGEAFMISATTPHSYGADPENPWSIYWMHLGGTSNNDAVKALFNNRNAGDALSAGFSSQRDDLFNEIAQVLLKGYSTSNLLFANLSLPYYLSTFISPESFQKNSQNSMQANPTQLAINFMQGKLSQTLTLDNIAQAAKLSASFFSRKFKQDTGYAPIEYFNHLRIQKACQLLHFSELRINEVALDIGIDDPFYFSRLFKKHMGISPVAYRNTYRK